MKMNCRRPWNEAMKCVALVGVAISILGCSASSVTSDTSASSAGGATPSHNPGYLVSWTGGPRNVRNEYLGIPGFYFRSKVLIPHEELEGVTTEAIGSVTGANGTMTWFERQPGATHQMVGGNQVILYQGPQARFDTASVLLQIDQDMSLTSSSPALRQAVKVIRSGSTIFVVEFICKGPLPPSANAFVQSFALPPSRAF